MEWFVLLPPIVAIVIAVWKKDVILSLLSALFCAETLLGDFHLAIGFLGVFDRVIEVFSNAGSSRILVFSLLIGALLNLIKKSGGVMAFVEWVSAKGLADNQRKVACLPTIIGICIFIETNLSILTAGFISRNCFDKVKMSRARLAYIIDSTCSPVCVILLFNAWGAMLLGLLNEHELENSVKILINSIPFNLYSWVTLILVFYTVWTGRVYGAMKRLESKKAQSLEPVRAHSFTEKQEAPTQMRFMLVPLLTMVGGIIFFMWYTGNGNILKGSGSQSVLWAVGVACFVAFTMIRLSSSKPVSNQLIKWSFEGMAELLPLVTTVLLALALAGSMKALGTASFVSSMVSENVPVWSVPALLFMSASIISFTTGTSWGTFSILIPIAVPIALGNDMPVEIVIAAVVGGGIFGDHCSPISDTTIVSSLAAGCDHMTHVETQLPYALIAGGASILGYLIIGAGL